MKKKILFGTVAAGIMLVSAICANRALSGGDKLLDANIEALTQEEASNDGTWTEVTKTSLGNTYVCCVKGGGQCRGFLACNEYED